MQLIKISILVILLNGLLNAEGLKKDPPLTSPWMLFPVGSWTELKPNEIMPALFPASREYLVSKGLNGVANLKRYTYNGIKWTSDQPTTIHSPGCIVTRETWKTYSLAGPFYDAKGLGERKEGGQWNLSKMPGQKILIDGKNIDCVVNKWVRKDGAVVTIYHGEKIDPLATYVALFGRNDVDVFIPNDAVKIEYIGTDKLKKVCTLDKWSIPIKLNKKEMKCQRWIETGVSVYGKVNGRYCTNKNVPGHLVSSEYSDESGKWVYNWCVSGFGMKKDG